MSFYSFNRRSLWLRLIDGRMVMLHNCCCLLPAHFGSIIFFHQYNPELSINDSRLLTCLEIGAKGSLSQGHLPLRLSKNLAHSLHPNSQKICGEKSSPHYCGAKAIRFKAHSIHRSSERPGKSSGRKGTDVNRQF